MKEYDVIIIGSGIGGLVSAGLLASQGMKPLVVEAHTRPGGYLSSFRRRHLGLHMQFYRLRIMLQQRIF